MMNHQEKKDSDPAPHSFSGPAHYEIKVQGELDPVWSKWFEGMTLSHVENGETGLACTMISGPVIDQPALHGLLARIRDLNLLLISVRRLNPEKQISEEVKIDIIHGQYGKGG